MKQLNDLAKAIHQNAKDKGFWDSPRNTGEIFMLIISEASEALEAHRKGRKADLKKFALPHNRNVSDDEWFKISFESCVKDTTADEIADVVIRILDYCASQEIEIKPALLSTTLISLDSDNFGAALFQICGEIQRAGEYALTNDAWDSAKSKDNIHSALTLIIQLCEREQIDLLKHIELKMKYNATRERMHGKAY